jgi:hypothetical protein
MRIPSIIGLVGALQQQGLTAAHLLVVLTWCQARHTGRVEMHLKDGRILAVTGVPHDPTVRTTHTDRLDTDPVRP